MGVALIEKRPLAVVVAAVKVGTDGLGTRNALIIVMGGVRL